MDLEKVKKSLEAAAEEIAPTQTLESLPSKFYDAFILQGLRIDRVEPGRLLCSLTVPPRLLVINQSIIFFFKFLFSHYLILKLSNYVCYVHC